VAADVPSRLRAAYEHVEDGIVVAGADERIIYVNAAFGSASAWPSAKALGRTVSELLRPRAVENESDVFAMTRANGEQYFARRKRAVLDRALGDEPLFLEIHRDVTAERALRESEVLYRKLAECSSDLISRADASARCIYMSPSCRQILGYEPEELVGRCALIELAHPDDLARRQAIRERFVATGIGSGSPVRMRVRRKDGTYVWLETLTHIERDGEGRILEVQSWARDVSARVAAEQALAQSEESLRSLLERLPAGAAVLRDGLVVYANAVFARMRGHERAEDLIGRSAFDFVSTAEREALEAQMKARAGVVWRRFVASDGSERTIEVTAVPLIFEGQLAFVAILHDVTEQERMEQRLAFAERLALVGRLASGVGHEINNPLAYMLGSLELARTDLARLGLEGPHGTIQRLEQHLLTVRDGAERVRDIVRDLKQLSIADDDRLGPVAVENTLDVATATVHHEIRQRARLVKEYGSVPPVLANERRLTQLFVNLLVNASQAIADGEVNNNEIRITTREEGGNVLVEIRDTGVGIAEKDLPRIFEPFFTTKPKGIGTGLGLSISHTIVTAHGGTLTAERLSPRGTMFRVTLRATSAAIAPKAPPESTPVARPSARILVIDAEPRSARVIAELLSSQHVTVAHSGREAIMHLDGDASFDAIVCDLHMNDGTGIDVYEHLVAHAPNLAERVIFMTGGAFTQRAKDFLDRCPRPVLEKPFAAAQLVTLVSDLTRR
jgi:PAS domain S-box-containing protein